jgi:hypothetical protein
MLSGKIIEIRQITLIIECQTHVNPNILRVDSEGINLFISLQFI